VPAPRGSSAGAMTGVCRSDLVVLDFDGVGTADEVLTKLRGMQKENLIDLEDACLVVHTEAGKVQLKQSVNLTLARNGSPDSSRPQIASRSSSRS
jgi:hypothetical protein